MKQFCLAGVFLLIGCFIFASCHTAWQADPVRHFVWVKATVLGHEIHLDEQRWKDLEKAALVVESRLLVPAPGSSGTSAVHELPVKAFFARAEAAADFAAGRPAGSTQDCLVAPTGDSVRWDSWPQNGAGTGMIVGGAMVLLALTIPFPWVEMRVKVILPLAAVSVFAVFGSWLARLAWSSTYQRVQAVDWPAVPFQKLGERTLHSTRSRSQEMAIRYAYQGHTYDEILTPPDAPSKPSEQCRVNPANPSQVYLDWGWRPFLAVGLLFPLPFLVIGYGGLLVLILPPLRRLLAYEGGREPVHPWGKAIMNGVALIFAGSIVGVFVAICAEMWFTDRSFKWPLTVFLLPFVYLVSRLAATFWRSVRAARRG